MLQRIFFLSVFLFLPLASVDARVYFDMECHYNKYGYREYCEYENISEKVEKYCSGNNKNDTKCRRYCEDVEQSSELCTDSKKKEGAKTVSSGRLSRVVPKFVATSASISEHAKKGDTVLDLELQNASAFQSVKFTLEESDRTKAFSLHANTGEIVVRNPDEINYEKTTQIVFTVHVEDVVADTSFAIPVTVDILDEEEEKNCTLLHHEHLTIVEHEKFRFSTALNIEREEGTNNLLIKKNNQTFVFTNCEKGEVPGEFRGKKEQLSVVLLRNDKGEFLFAITEQKRVPFLFFFERKRNNLIHLPIEIEEI